VKGRDLPLARGRFEPASLDLDSRSSVRPLHEELLDPLPAARQGVGRVPSLGVDEELVGRGGRPERLEEGPLVRPGMAVAIDERDLGINATGVVHRVADTPGTFGVDGFHIYLEILVDETPLSLEGVSLRLTIPTESTKGPVTVVPVSALSLAADGTSRVQVDNDGTLEFVVVEPGLSADGFVEVTPVDGTLAPGQLVVIGYK